jgi:LysR family transcriptional regulator, transcriptional activator for bauABCD operon
LNLEGSDLRLLKVFDAVVRHGGLAAAQSELNISLSTISNHVTALEERLGVQLCQRGRGGFRLTDKGELAVAAIQRLLNGLDDFSADIGALRGKLLGELKIGLLDSVVTDGNSRLHDAIRRFRQRPNDVTFCLFQEQPQVLQEKILGGLFNLGIGSTPHKISGLAYEFLYEEHHSLYCGRGHTLFERCEREISAGEVLTHPVSSRGYWREGQLRQMGFERVEAIVYHIEPQLSLIMSGGYLGFLPDHYARAWVAQDKIRRVQTAPGSYTCAFEIITRRGDRATELTRTFINDLRACYKEALPAPGPGGSV